MASQNPVDLEAVYRTLDYLVTQPDDLTSDHAWIRISLRSSFQALYRQANATAEQQQVCAKWLDELKDIQPAQLSFVVFQFVLEELPNALKESIDLHRNAEFYTRWLLSKSFSTAKYLIENAERLTARPVDVYAAKSSGVSDLFYADQVATIQYLVEEAPKFSTGHFSCDRNGNAELHAALLRFQQWNFTGQLPVKCFNYLLNTAWKFGVKFPYDAFFQSVSAEIAKLPNAGDWSELQQQCRQLEDLVQSCLESKILDVAVAVSPSEMLRLLRQSQPAATRKRVRL